MPYASLRCKNLFTGPIKIFPRREKLGAAACWRIPIWGQINKNEEIDALRLAQVQKSVYGSNKNFSKTGETRRLLPLRRFPYGGRLTKNCNLKPYPTLRCKHRFKDPIKIFPRREKLEAVASSRIPIWGQINKKQEFDALRLAQVQKSVQGSNKIFSKTGEAWRLLPVG